MSTKVRLYFTTSPDSRKCETVQHKAAECANVGVDELSDEDSFLEMPGKSYFDVAQLHAENKQHWRAFFEIR